jgi:hypothetical protein
MHMSSKFSSKNSELAFSFDAFYVCIEVAILRTGQIIFCTATEKFFILICMIQN